MPNQDTTLQQIALLKSRGLSVRQIAEAVGKPKSTVHDMIQDYNLNDNMPGANEFEQQHQRQYQNAVFSGLEGVDSKTNFILNQLQQQIRELRDEKQRLQMQLSQKDSESIQKQLQLMNLQNQLDNKSRDLDRLQREYDDKLNQVQEEKDKGNTLAGLAGTLFDKVAKNPQMLPVLMGAMKGGGAAALSGTPAVQSSAEASVTLEDDPKQDMIDQVAEWLSNQSEEVVTKFYAMTTAITRKKGLFVKIINLVENELQG